MLILATGATYLGLDIDWNEWKVYCIYLESVGREQKDKVKPLYYQPDVGKLGITVLGYHWKKGYA